MLIAIMAVMNIFTALSLIRARCDITRLEHVNEMLVKEQSALVKKESDFEGKCERMIDAYANIVAEGVWVKGDLDD